MTAHDQIDAIITLGISIIDKCMQALNAKTELTKPEADQLCDYLKTLVTVRRDWRLAEKEQVLDTKALSNDELEKAILEEADKIRSKVANAG